MKQWKTKKKVFTYVFPKAETKEGKTSWKSPCNDKRRRTKLALVFTIHQITLLNYTKYFLSTIQSIGECGTMIIEEFGGLGKLIKQQALDFFSDFCF